MGRNLGLPVTVEVKPVHSAPATAGSDWHGEDRPAARSAMDTAPGMESCLAEAKEGRRVHDLGDVPGHRDDLRALHACGVG